MIQEGSNTAQYMSAMEAYGVVYSYLYDNLLRDRHLYKYEPYDIQYDNETVFYDLDISDKIEGLSIRFMIPERGETARGGFGTDPRGNRYITLFARNISAEMFEHLMDDNPTRLFETFKQVFIHEYVHYLDYLRAKNRNVFKKANYRDDKGKTVPSLYQNNPLEMNAIFNQYMSSLYDIAKTPWRLMSVDEKLDKLGRSPTEFVKVAIKTFDAGRPGYVEALTQANKRKLHKRIYDAYSVVQEMIKAAHKKDPRLKKVTLH